MKKIETIQDRLKYIRKNIAKLNQIEFGKKIQLNSNSIVSQLEKGTRNITDRTINDICREFNINEEWLRNGTGEIFKEKSSESIDLLADEFQLDEMSKYIVEQFINMKEDDRSLLMDFITNLYNAKLKIDAKEEKVQEEQKSVELMNNSIIELPISARGSGTNLVSLTEDEYNELVEKTNTNKFDGDFF